MGGWRHPAAEKLNGPNAVISTERLQFDGLLFMGVIFARSGPAAKNVPLCPPHAKVKDGGGAAFTVEGAAFAIPFQLPIAGTAQPAADDKIVMDFLLPNGRAGR
jgi:hypothetical protein